MSSLKWFNNLLFMENILGIHRNYCSQKKNYKYCIVFQIFVQTVLHAAFVVHEIHKLSEGKYNNPINVIYVLFTVFAFITYMSCIMTTICYTHAFMAYYRNISHVIDTFKHDKKLIRSLKKTCWLSGILVTLFFTFIAYRSAQLIIFILQGSVVTEPYFLVFVFLSQTIVRMTVIFQQIMLIIVVMIIVNLTEYLKSLISVVQSRIGSIGCHVNLDEQCNLTGEQIQGWSKIYKDLANCCENVTLSFGRQFVFSLIMSMLYYVSLTNHLCNKSGMWHNGDKKVVIIMMCFAILTLMPIIAVQHIRNEGVKFHRVLVRLYNTIIVITDSNKTKLIKDFIRLVKENPLEIKLLPKMPTGMCMLPVILTLAVNYLIVILQINNIV